MPKRDGTGPYGQGSLTGRQMGFCTGARQNIRNNNFNRGFMQSRYKRFQGAIKQNKESLENEIAYLEEQLKATKARYSSFNE